MIWNDAKIKELGNKLFVPFDEANVQPASYDVTLSNKIKYFTKTYQADPWFDAANRKMHCIRYKELDISGRGMVLEPGEFILGSTNEVITVPNNAAARFEGKSSLGRLGLMTHVTAGFIDPGFQGQLTLEIKNANAFPIRITAGMAIGQICFMDLIAPAEHPYGSAELGSHYQNQLGATPAVTLVSDRSEEISQVDNNEENNVGTPEPDVQ